MEIEIKLTRTTYHLKEVYSVISTWLLFHMALSYASNTVNKRGETEKRARKSLTGFTGFGLHIAAAKLLLPLQGKVFKVRKTSMLKRNV